MRLLCSLNAIGLVGKSICATLDWSLGKLFEEAAVRRRPTNYRDDIRADDATPCAVILSDDSTHPNAIRFRSASQPCGALSPYGRPPDSRLAVILSSVQTITRREVCRQFASYRRLSQNRELPPKHPQRLDNISTPVTINIRLGGSGTAEFATAAEPLPEWLPKLALQML